VNGYVVVPYTDHCEVLYECERKYWDKEVHEMYKDLSRSNINCPIIPPEIYYDNDCKKATRIAYFAILEDY
jgi:hypothetical protein